MNYVAGQDCLCTVYHKKWCEFGSAIRRGPQPPEYGVELLNLVLVWFFQRPHQSRLDAAHNKTVGAFYLTVGLWVVD